MASLVIDLFRFLDPDPRLLVHELGTSMNKKFWNLNKALAQLVSQGVSFCFRCQGALETRVHKTFYGAQNFKLKQSNQLQ